MLHSYLQAVKIINNVQRSSGLQMVMRYLLQIDR